MIFLKLLKLTDLPMTKRETIIIYLYNGSTYPNEKSLKNGVLFVLVWVAWVACLRGWRASVGGVLAWWGASVGGVGDVLAWVAC